MSDIYFTSDNHFYHKNIIQYCNRPFESVEDMNEKMVKRWNSVVKPNDTVYDLGDFAMGSGAKEIEIIFKRLNGKKILIKGNHDAKPTLNCQWYSIHDMLEININGQKIVLLHFAMKVWNNSHRDSWQLYGHSHMSLPESSSLSFDVGVDGWNYAPISISRIAEKMKWKKENIDFYSSPEYVEANKDKDSTFKFNQEFNHKF